MTPAIIIPNWNGQHHLQDCLASLRQQTTTQFDVFLVDNGSTDGSQAFVRQQFPEIHLIELSQNRGFTGACNAGYAATAAHHDPLILLNNDTITAPTWLAELLDALQRHPRAGSVVGKILLHEPQAQPARFHTAGDYYTIAGLPGNRGVWQPDQGQYDTEERVFSGCGAAVAYRRAVLEEIGFLDNALFFSCEDVDLGWRINLAGWQVWYIPTAVVYHKLKASGGTGTTSSYYDGRNRLYLIAKNYPPRLLRQNWRHIFAAQRHLTHQALRHWRGPAARATLRGQLAGLWAMAKLWPQRRHLAATQRIPHDELTALLTPVDAP